MNKNNEADDDEEEEMKDDQEYNRISINNSNSNNVNDVGGDNGVDTSVVANVGVNSNADMENNSNNDIIAFIENYHVSIIITQLQYSTVYVYIYEAI